jgi:hypothetical protein
MKCNFTVCTADFRASFEKITAAIGTLNARRRRGTVMLAGIDVEQTEQGISAITVKTQPAPRPMRLATGKGIVTIRLHNFADHGKIEKMLTVAQNRLRKKSSPPERRPPPPPQ